MRPRSNHPQFKTHEPQGRAVIGIHSAHEVLKVRPHAVKEIWLKKGSERDLTMKPFVEFAERTRRPLRFQQEGALNQIASSHQGVCLWVTETPELDLADLPGAESMAPITLLALDEISDPHNVGALLRSAWLFGCAGLIVPERRTAHLTPSVIKVASGGAEHVPVIVSAHLNNDLTILKDKGFWIYGLAGEGHQTLSQIRFHEKAVLLIGAEDKGLRTSTRRACDEMIRIPQLDVEASFNASVAGAIALYEVRRQRQNP